MAPKKNSKSFHYPMVDALRGLAALTIVVYHVIEIIEWETFPLSGPLGALFRAGWMAVDLFFVVSGFVIAISAKRCYDGAASPREFWKVYFLKRFFRIVPLHFLTCGIFLIFISPATMLRPDVLWHIFTHLLFIHNWFPETCGSINGSNWSLGVEVQFYLLMALMVKIFTKFKPSFFLMTSVAVSWAWRSGAYTIFEGQTLEGVNLVWLYTCQMVGMLDLFGWGCALALMKMQGVSLIQSSKYAYLNHWMTYAGLACLVGTPVMKVYWNNATYWDNPAMVIFWRTFAGLFWVLVLEAACVMGTGNISQWVAPLRYLGTISYGIYLWHLLVISSISRTDLVHRPMNFLVLTVICTTICASISWHFFEKPILDTYGHTGCQETLILSSPATWTEKYPVLQSCDRNEGNKKGGTNLH